MITFAEMKKLLAILMTILLAACDGATPMKDILARAEHAMTVSPDSALTILDSARTYYDDAPKSYQMHYQLLLTDARNKTYADLGSDSIMKSVVQYYDRHRSPNEQVHAHYLLGCVYRDLGEAPMALRCYQEALDKADTTSRTCDYALLGKVCSQMANTFHAENSPDYALQFFQLGIKYSALAGDTLS